MRKEYIFRLVLFICIAIVVYEFGIKPAYLKNSPTEPVVRKQENWAIGKLAAEKGTFDVIVVGDEPDGIAAAVSAARSGARTLLLSESADMGGIVSKGLDTKLDRMFGYRGESISKGFFTELHGLLGEDFTVDKYLSTIDGILKKEKNLELAREAKQITPVMEDNAVVGIKALVQGQEKRFTGKRFIDSTRNGIILSACNVPFSSGESDLNLKKAILPARLNFEIEGAAYKDIKAVIDVYKGKFYDKLKEYKTYHLNTAINDFKVSNNGENRVIVQGIELVGLDIGDSNGVKAAYDDAVDEAQNFTAFLANNFDVFNRAKFLKPAEKLIMPEARHFHGEQTLSVIEVLENRDFKDKIALGAHPVATYLEDNKKYYLGKPVQYAIPLGCIIPQKVENLIMTGGKISYSSLAATSADKVSVNITTGQSAGIVAVYSITRGMTPRQLVKEKDENTTREIEKLLQKQGVYLPDFEINNKNASLWCYDSLKKLMSLGLVAGGLDNNFKVNSQAREQDLGYILLNGVYRLSPDKYNYKFDASLRPYLNEKKLTKEKAAEILLAFHGEDPGRGGFYDRACKSEYIDELIQIRLKDKAVLTMDDVYYLGAYNIRLYTGKNITY